MFWLEVTSLWMNASLLPGFFSTRYLILQLETTNFHRTLCSLVIQTLVLLLEVGIDRNMSWSVSVRKE